MVNIPTLFARPSKGTPATPPKLEPSRVTSDFWSIGSMSKKPVKPTKKVLTFFCDEKTGESVIVWTQDVTDPLRFRLIPAPPVLLDLTDGYRTPKAITYNREELLIISHLANGDSSFVRISTHFYEISSSRVFTSETQAPQCNSVIQVQEFTILGPYSVSKTPEHDLVSYRNRESKEWEHTQLKSKYSNIERSATWTLFITHAAKSHRSRYIHYLAQRDNQLFLYSIREEYLIESLQGEPALWKRIQVILPIGLNLDTMEECVPGYILNYDSISLTHQLYIFWPGFNSRISYFFLPLRYDGSPDTMTDKIEGQGHTFIPGSEAREKGNFRVVDLNDRVLCFWNRGGVLHGMSAPIQRVGIMDREWAEVCDEEQRPSCPSQSGFNCVVVPGGFCSTPPAQ